MGLGVRDGFKENGAGDGKWQRGLGTVSGRARLLLENTARS